MLSDMGTRYRNAHAAAIYLTSMLKRGQWVITEESVYGGALIVSSPAWCDVEEHIELGLR